jgi:hypothetical protein
VIQLGPASADQLIEVTQGLTALDKLIVGGREGLADGTRIRIIGTDRNLGTTSVRAASTPTADATTLNGQIK